MHRLRLMVPRVMLKYKAAGNVSPWVEGSERNADALSRLADWLLRGAS